MEPNPYEPPQTKPEVEQRPLKIFGMTLTEFFIVVAILVILCLLTLPAVSYSTNRPWPD